MIHNSHWSLHVRATSCRGMFSRAYSSGGFEKTFLEVRKPLSSHASSLHLAQLICFALVNLRQYNSRHSASAFMYRSQPNLDFKIFLRFDMEREPPLSFRALHFSIKDPVRSFRQSLSFDLFSQSSKRFIICWWWSSRSMHAAIWEISVRDMRG